MALDSQSSANRALSFETPADFAALKHPVDVLWRVEDISSVEVRRNPRWLAAFSGERKDRRYYEVCEETIDQEFDYRYLALKDERGEICAIQPYFINDQDVLAEASPELLKFLSPVRHLWPRFMKMRTLMLGCPAGHGHLDAQDGISGHRLAQSLASVITGHAKRLRASVIVFKEFTVHDRPVLSCLEDRGFKRVPSMPLTQVKLDFSTFEDYLRNVLSRNMRSKLRRKFKESERLASLEMRVVSDATPYIDEIFPLYQAVYARSNIHFEKLTPEYFCQIGQKMPDKTVFFLWFKEGKVVCFNMCLSHNDSLCSEYIGFDYKVAFDLHLYYIAIRDVMKWALANGYQWYCSTGLNYEPKFHLKHELDPLDLYIKHTNPIFNFVLKRALPYLEPTRSDKVLQRFSNYSDLHAKT
jgi:hypothetical protein